MQHLFEQGLHFLKQGILAIVQFVQLIWGWSVGQIVKLASVPWQEWPWWKDLLLLIVIAAVIWAIYGAARQLLAAGAAILASFAALLAVVVQTLPSVLLAGVIALGGVWVINHLDNSLVRLPVAWYQSKASAPNASPAGNSSAAPTNGGSAKE
jgi:hypothetical protein